MIAVHNVSIILVRQIFPGKPSAFLQSGWWVFRVQGILRIPTDFSRGSQHRQLQKTSFLMLISHLYFFAKTVLLENTQAVEGTWIHSLYFPLNIHLFHVLQKEGKCLIHPHSYYVKKNLLGFWTRENFTRSSWG